MILVETNKVSEQFVENPQSKIPQDKKDLIDKLLLERISLAGIARVVRVSESWLQRYVNRKYQEVPRHVDVKKKQRQARDSM